MTTQTVKIVRFHQIGAPEVLQLDELPLPEPGGSEVRLRVEAIGTVPAFPANAYGVYGEVAIVPLSAVAEYPAHLSYEEGASIWMQYITAYGALIHESKLTKADFIIITAASSSVGIAAIEIAKAQQAISIATTRTAKKKAELLAAGTDQVIVTDEEDLPERVSEITGGMGARVIFDPIGGQGLEALAAAAAPSGIIFQYGILATEPTRYPLLTALSKHLTIKAYTLFEVVANPDAFPEEFLKAKHYVFDNLAKGTFKPRICKTFPLSQIVDAHRYMESNAQVGKIVVTV
jgi:NADPH:quinone reductase-like Zn-dependent oxidoreductase